MLTPTAETMSEIQEPFFEQLLERSKDHQVFLVFLRHFGCLFCREMVSDLKSVLPAFEALEIEIAFVHVGTDDQADVFFKEYGFPNAARFSDPESRIYEIFGLQEVSMAKLMSVATFAGSIRALRSGARQGKVQGNPKMMPGIFVISDGHVVKKFVHESPGDKPDLMALIEDDDL
jgi:peroxiredoxin